MNVGSSVRTAFVEVVRFFETLTGSCTRYKLPSYFGVTLALFGSCCSGAE